jgi:tetratricopeptide (TPR) repeat protein
LAVIRIMAASSQGRVRIGGVHPLQHPSHHRSPYDGDIDHPFEIRLTMRHPLRSWFAAPFAALFAASVLAAQPTLHDIQAAISAGHYAQADREIAQALAAHPDSAVAHYGDARLLADEGKWPLARAELSRAEALAPAMGFVHPDVLAAFRRHVRDHTQGGAARSISPGFIVGAMAFVLIFVYLVAGMFRA